MAKTRDIIIHHYEVADVTIVWKIVKDYLPNTIIEIEKILNDLDK